MCPNLISLLQIPWFMQYIKFLVHDRGAGQVCVSTHVCFAANAPVLVFRPSSTFSSLLFSQVQAYVRSHINTCIYTLDFLKNAKARGAEKDEVEETIAAMCRLHTQVIGHTRTHVIM